MLCGKKSQITYVVQLQFYPYQKIAYTLYYHLVVLCTVKELVRLMFLLLKQHVLALWDNFKNRAKLRLSSPITV